MQQVGGLISNKQLCVLKEVIDEYVSIPSCHI